MFLLFFRMVCNNVRAMVQCSWHLGESAYRSEDHPSFIKSDSMKTCSFTTTDRAMDRSRLGGWRLPPNRTEFDDCDLSVVLILPAFGCIFALTWSGARIIFGVLSMFFVISSGSSLKPKTLSVSRFKRRVAEPQTKPIPESTIINQWNFWKACLGRWTSIIASYS